MPELCRRCGWTTRPWPGGPLQTEFPEVMVADNHAPRPALAWLGVTLAAATGWVLREGLNARRADLLVVVSLFALAVVATEIGRHTEGDRVVGQRPNKGLSGWVFAAAVISSAPLVLLVVVPVYTYARYRGLRIALWRWMVSGAVLVSAGAVAQLVVQSDRWGISAQTLLIRLVAAGAAFMIVENVMLAICGIADGTDDAQWLLKQLVSSQFHLTEASVLAAAAVVALLYLASPWLVLLTIPSYVMMQRAMLHEPLREQAAHDGKTGLLTHGAWSEAAERELRSTSACAVVIFDLDHFKQVNDVHGHLIGDRVLRAAAQALLGALRSQDLAGRFGGEEFCVLLPGVSHEQMHQICERVRSAVAAVRVDGFGGSLTISAGLCRGPDAAGADLLTLLEIADAALYRAKHDGRDRAVALPA